MPFSIERLHKLDALVELKGHIPYMMIPLMTKMTLSFAQRDQSIMRTGETVNPEKEISSLLKFRGLHE